MKELIHKEIFNAEPSAMIVLYELVLKYENMKSYRFHAGENGFENAIIFNKKDYHYIPIRADGFDYGDGKLPRPTLTADNTESFFSLKSRFFKDFIGYELIRTRTFVKFLDAVNFPNNVNPYGSPTATSYPPEKYIINRKNLEDSQTIQFELVSPLEYENAKIPNRKIVYNACQWQYRHHIGCGYKGLPVTDSKGNPLSFNGTKTPPNEWKDGSVYAQGNYVQISPDRKSPNTPPRVYVCLNDGTSSNPQSDKANWTADACPKNISGCRARFGNTEVVNGLPFGGFPGTWQY
jgi:lambda family phage minor tail protein L|tara:strand:- start:428 stop:1303 length:876 start_codon:yes stop_codon:yes gene_type:complete